MKIEETNQQVAINLFRNEKVEEQAAARENAKPAEQTAKPQARGDNVNLSPAVERLNKATEFLKDIPETRPDRVQEVKGQIETGQYNVNSKDVAAKMLNVMKNGYSG